MKEEARESLLSGKGRGQERMKKAKKTILFFSSLSQRKESREDEESKEDTPLPLLILSKEKTTRG